MQPSEKRRYTLFPPADKNRRNEPAHEAAPSGVQLRRFKAPVLLFRQERVDFRDLVKDLAKEFKVKIEMRQVGVRDEAKIIGGLGIAGTSFAARDS